MNYEHLVCEGSTVCQPRQCLPEGAYRLLTVWCGNSYRYVYEHNKRGQGVQETVGHREEVKSHTPWSCGVQSYGLGNGSSLRLRLERSMLVSKLCQGGVGIPGGR